VLEHNSKEEGKSGEEIFFLKPKRDMCPAIKRTFPERWVIPIH
jgi:hypothetical protein